MQNQIIINQSREWLGTKFIHRQHLMKSSNNHGGSDCLGFLICLSKQLKLKTKEQKLLCEYHLPFYEERPKNTLLKEFLDHNLIKVSEAIPGSIALFNIAGWPVHIALIANFGDQLTLIHQLRSAGCLVEHSLNDSWKKRMINHYIFANQ